MSSNTKNIIGGPAGVGQTTFTASATLSHHLDYTLVPKVLLTPAKVVLWLTQTITFCALSFRAYVRYKVFRRYFLDDALLLIAWLLSLAGSILYQVKMSALFLVMGPRSQNVITDPTDLLAQVSDFMRTDSTLLILWVLTMWFVKFSFLAFFRKLGHNVRRQRLLWRIVLVVTIATFIITYAIPSYGCSFGAATRILACITSPSGKSSYRTLLEISTACDIITEVLILVLPISLLWKVKISLRQKLTLGALLSLTVFTVAVAIARIILALDVIAELDVTWLNMLSVVEQDVAILVACLVSYRALFTAKSVPDATPVYRTASKERILWLRNTGQSSELEESKSTEETTSEA